MSERVGQPRTDGQFRYIRHSDLDAYLRQGWMVVAHLGPHHGQYAVLCWRCDCQ